VVSINSSWTPQPFKKHGLFNHKTWDNMFEMKLAIYGSARCLLILWIMKPWNGNWNPASHLPNWGSSFHWIPSFTCTLQKNLQGSYYYGRCQYYSPDIEFIKYNRSWSKLEIPRNNVANSKSYIKIIWSIWESKVTDSVQSSNVSTSPGEPGDPRGSCGKSGIFILELILEIKFNILNTGCGIQRI
jgi:hypothetical protein